MVGDLVYIKERNQNVIGKVVNETDTEILVEYKAIVNTSGICFCPPGTKASFSKTANIQNIGFNKLITNRDYGTVAEDIYSICVYLFKFDSTQIGRFAKQQLLFAKNATREDYDVWFICNSEYGFASPNEDPKWRNEINESKTQIKEYYLRKGDTLEGKLGEIRLTFLKKKNGVYEFIGLFKATTMDTVNQVKIYDRISDQYM